MRAAFDPTTLTHRAADLMEQGLTRKQLRGAGWERTEHGLVRPAGIGLDPVTERISDASATTGGVRAIGGWASLWLQGNHWFDGRDRHGSVRPVLVHCSDLTQLRRRAAVEPCRAALHDGELVWMNHGWVTTMARAAYDEMRIATSLTEAVVVADLATSTVLDVARTTPAELDRLVASHVKTRGIVQARKALALASTRSASP